MQMPAAMAIALSAMARASSVVCLHQRPGGGRGVGAARSDPDDPVVGLDQVAVARQQERRVRVHDDQHRLEAPKDAVGSPVFRQLDGRPFDLAAVLLELGLEAREQRERIGGRSGEPGEDLVVVEPPDLPGALLDDRVAQRDLPVPGQYRLAGCVERPESSCCESWRAPLSGVYRMAEKGVKEAARCAARMTPSASGAGARVEMGVIC